MNKIMVTKAFLPDFDEYCDMIKPIWDTYHLTNNGNLHMQLQNKLIEFFDIPNVTLFTNGHLALYTAIKSLKLKGNVITTPFTFASTINAIVENNLTPIFCDINPDDYTIDVDKLESLINEKTSAIVAVHVYGNICNVKKINEIAKSHNIKVIYDAAHVFGVKYRGKSIFNFGDIAMTSFHATKVFNTIEGGALFYNDNKLYDKLNALKNFGIDGQGEIIVESINAKMNEFQAAMGLCNMKYIDEVIGKRKRIYERYIENLKCLKGVKLNYIQPEVESNYSYFPVIFDEKVFGKSRDDIFEELASNNIYARKYFYPLVTDFAFYKEKFDSNDTPIAKEIAKNILCLPLYMDLELNDVDRICNIIKGK